MKLYPILTCMGAIWYVILQFSGIVYSLAKYDQIICYVYVTSQVLERAKEGESLEELRARTAAQFTTEQNGFQTTKLSKKRKQMAVLDDGSSKFGRIAD